MDKENLEKVLRPFFPPVKEYKGEYEAYFTIKLG